MQKKFNLWRCGDRSGIYYVRFQHSPGKWYSSGYTAQVQKTVPIRRDIKP